MKERILVLTNNMGGLHSFRKEVMKAILDAGYDVVISSPDCEEQREKAAYFESLGCTLVKLPFNRRGTNPIKDLGLVRNYVKLIRQVSPKIVLTYTIKPNIYGGIAAALCKTVQFANITGLGTSIMNPGLLQKLNIFLYRIGLRKAKVVFFQNQFNMDFCKSKGMVRCKSVLLPGSGVNLLHHQPIPYPEENDVVKFGFAGRMMRDKGIYELIEAVKSLHAKGRRMQLVIAGSFEEHCESLIGDLQRQGVVLHLGQLSDIRVLMQQIHCLVNPSYHEGMSNVLQEASAAERPVIASYIPGCKEIVDDTVSGYLFEVKNAVDLEDKIEQFLNLSYAQRVTMGKAARAKVEREFDRSIVVNKYLNEIEQLKK